MNKPIAILLIYSKNGKQINTYCIPTEDADQSMWDKTLKELGEVDLPEEMFKALSMALMHFAANNIENK